MSATCFVRPALTLWQREIVRFCRQRNRIIGALATPVVFWLLIGSGLGPSFRLPDTPENMRYIEYFFPGTLALIMLFTAIFSTISIIEDRREGFLQNVLVAPVSPGAIVLGKMLGGTVLAAGQGFLFLLCAPFIGLAITPWILLKLLLAFSIVGLGLTGLGFLIAWPMDSTQGFHAIMNIFLMPLWLLSGALFPTPAGSIMRWVVLANPVTYGVAAIRRSLYEVDPGVPGLPGYATSIVVSVLFAAVMYAIAYSQVRARRKVY
jgi:ABC-2 type transport system permease protein